MTQYSILVDVEFETQQIQKKLKDATKSLKDVKINVDDKDIKDATKAAEDFGLTFQEANLVMQKSLDIISQMVDEVYTLNDSMTELKKVSSLDDSGLDKYQEKLTNIGKTVGRTGKPKCQARNVRIVN